MKKGQRSECARRILKKKRNGNVRRGTQKTELKKRGLPTGGQNAVKQQGRGLSARATKKKDRHAAVLKRKEKKKKAVYPEFFDAIKHSLGTREAYPRGNKKKKKGVLSRRIKKKKKACYASETW